MKRYQKLAWFRSGVLGIAVGFVFSALDTLVCIQRGHTCPWEGPVTKIGYAYDAVVRYIGGAFGVRFGYVPYYPNRATQIFLAVLAPFLVWSSWFLLGIILHTIVHATRRPGGPPSSP